MMASLIAMSLASLESCVVVVLQPTKMTWPSLFFPIYAIPCLVPFFAAPPAVVMRTYQLLSGVHDVACVVFLTKPVFLALLGEASKNLFNKDLDVKMISIGLGCFPSNMIGFL
jgi:hypothetical protein